MAKTAVEATDVFSIALSDHVAPGVVTLPENFDRAVSLGAKTDESPPIYGRTLRTAIASLLC